MGAPLYISYVPPSLYHVYGVLEGEFKPPVDVARTISRHPQGNPQSGHTKDYSDFVRRSKERSRCDPERGNVW